MKSVIANDDKTRKLLDKVNEGRYELTQIESTHIESTQIESTQIESTQSE